MTADLDHLVAGRQEIKHDLGDPGLPRSLRDQMRTDSLFERIQVNKWPGRQLRQSETLAEIEMRSLWLDSRS